MSYTFTHTELVIVGLVATATVLIYKKLSASRSHLPPGPKPLPLVGNLFDMPKHEQWLTYEKWGHEYNSDVLHIQVLGTDIIIVNSAKAATALFERKSGLYSDRPRLTMISELIGLSWHFGFMPYGDTWRKTRRMFNEELNASGAARFKPQILKWNTTFLKNVLTSPENFMEHIQHMASGIVLETSFGMQVQPSGQPDPFIRAAKQAVEAMMHAGLYGSYLVDYLPILKYVPTPFAQFQKDAKKWHVSAEIAGTVPFDLVKKAVAENKAEPSIAASLIRKSASSDQEAIAQATHAMFASGSAATVSALSTFFLAMTIYPEVQAKAQAELDKVLSGQNRLPDFSDAPLLPYINAIVKEISRWNPVVPLAFPHKLTADDTYNGYHLPAGSVVVPNAWAMLHDVDTYGPDTYDFKPERFLTAEGQLNTAVKDPDAAFGFARRTCPGRYLAHESLFITIATSLAAFKVTMSLDAAGKPIKPSGEYTDGMLRYPLPFTCKITPRSEAMKALI